MRMLVLVGVMGGLLVAVTGCASVKSITPEQLAPTLAGIQPMPVYYRTVNNKGLEIDHLAYLHEPHPRLSKYPFLRIEYIDKCVDSTYNPTGLIVSAVTFPLAVVGHAGWGANAGSSTCNGYQTSVRFSICESRKSVVDYEMLCAGDSAPTGECRKFVDAATAKWNKDAEVISIEDDKETAYTVHLKKMEMIRELTGGSRR